ncbi:MAG: MFS transporter [Oscillospiraceae bacterium]|nr:MFS transporter [Oscillospiraceae bacterium]
MTDKKRNYLILGIVYLTFIALGIQEVAGVAWPAIRYDLGLPLEWAGAMMIVNSTLFALTSSQLGRISKRLGLERITLLGTVCMALGLTGIALAPSFPFIIGATTFLGVGAGFVDPSVNSYMARSFSTKLNNWLHCFWGMGAMIGPIIMTRMIHVSGWRPGYIAVAAFLGVTALVLLVSILRGVWNNTGTLDQAEQSSIDNEAHYLTKKRYLFTAVFFFFLFGTLEHSMGFWITSVLIESRGMYIGIAGLYPAVYFGFIMVGRILFGFVAEKMQDAGIIRIGFCVAAVGVLILLFTGHIAGMALTGLGFAPIFPCVMHANAARFHPDVFTKLVGYQLAALGAGIAILSSLTGQVLSHISLEALFPIALGLIAITWAINESLERALVKTAGK